MRVTCGGVAEVSTARIFGGKRETWRWGPAAAYLAGRRSNLLLVPLSLLLLRLRSLLVLLFLTAQVGEHACPFIPSIHHHIANYITFQQHKIFGFTSLFLFLKNPKKDGTYISLIRTSQYKWKKSFTIFGVRNSQRANITHKYNQNKLAKDSPRKKYVEICESRSNSSNNIITSIDYCAGTQRLRDSLSGLKYLKSHMINRHLRVKFFSSLGKQI